MSEGNLKDKAMQTAMRLMQNKRVQQAMQNPKVQRAFSEAIDRGARIKRDIEQLKRQMATRLDLATEDDLQSMKMELQKLQREMNQVKREKEAEESKG
jgi:hypothetical protein